MASLSQTLRWRRIDLVRRGLGVESVKKLSDICHNKLNGDRDVSFLFVTTGGELEKTFTVIGYEEEVTMESEWKDR